MSMRNVVRLPNELGSRVVRGRPEQGAIAAEPGFVIGYASVAEKDRVGEGPELQEQAEVIARECERRGFALLELVHDLESEHRKGLERPGLSYALRRISEGEADGLVVSELSRLTRSVVELGVILRWFSRFGVRLVAAAQALDTLETGGRLAARALVEVSGWERQRLSERTRKGLEAARRKRGTGGRPAVSDNPDLRRRIAQMRAQGMTLQAIADRLNEEGVPTVRGGAKWRHSSVQAAAGYRRRRRRRTPPDSLPQARSAARRDS